MGNRVWLRRALQKTGPQTNAHYCEIGAGDGALAKYLIRKLAPAAYTGMDIIPEPDIWPSTAKWQRGDLLDDVDYSDATHLIANLILHHFETEQLNYIGGQIQNSTIQTIVACEPCRRKVHQLQLSAGRLIGFNQVTLHDGHVSVEAGFRFNELPQLLGLQPSKWQWAIRETFMGAYRMVAQRI